MKLEVRDIAWYKSKAKEINSELDTDWVIVCPNPNILPTYKTLMSIMAFARSLPFRF